MNDQRERRGHGCCFYGCLSITIVLLACLLAAVFLTRYYVRQTIIKYSDPAPASLPKTVVSQETITRLHTRLDEFAKALQAGTAKEDLELDSLALNLLLANTPELQQVSDKFYIAIEDDEVKAQFSWPLDQLPLFPTPGRYLNGTAILKLSLQNGVPVVTLHSIEVKGKPLPDELTAVLRNQNLARDLTSNAKIADVLRRIEKVEVTDGKLIITPAR